jgi:predicted nucleic acid-binding protein
MADNDYLIDTNILIYHTAGDRKSVDFLRKVIERKSFHISILTKIEFLGWDRHTAEGFEKCKRLVEEANILMIDNIIADKTIELKRNKRMKLADAIIAATAMVNNLTLVTRNTGDFKLVGLSILDPFSE